MTVDSRSLLSKIPSVWTVVDLELAALVMINGVVTLVKDGPYAPATPTGICLPNYGAVGCYSAYPGSLILFSAFMLVLTRKDAKAAIAVMAFNVSFGELLFTVATMPTAFYPAHDVFNPANFQPYITAVWLGSVLVVPLVLRHRHRIQFDWLFIPWFATETFVQFWEPYIHTTLWSLGVSDVLIVWQFWVVWRLFGMHKR